MRGRRRQLLLACIASLAFVIVGCRAETTMFLDIGDVGTRLVERVISGEEAQRLYGIDPGGEVATARPISTPEPWFPMQVWVSASVLPYDDPDPILVLPVYADREMGVQSTWVGDLAAGTSVMLLSVHPDGRACYVEGVAHQGWEVEGWVACNRLLSTKPTSMFKRDMDGQ